ncbi:response regulator transcription factor [Paenibacillus eucommiae]|uniref:DNA-binding response OmpR family regulator n=1 Tax=Paenibacillus eucommiae TaxID=1355755 RepID=A0ABS4IQY9_9BACL|nr:response regulator transcription factor [Paenibacillus eucommiae]MBP1989993.1 DNA-binding response OmpR family regulator [Paenibacillus eucommiae]
MLKKTILVVDDDADINELLNISLTREGYHVVSAYRGADAIPLVIQHQPDLIILDVLLPDIDGFEICRELRKTSTIPILFLSCKDEEIDKVLGLGFGGDDYMAKPFSPIELVARVKAHMRRNYLLRKDIKEDDSILNFPGLSIDRSTHRVLVDGQQVSLSAKEFKLLFHLAQNPNRVYKNDQLFSLLWDEHFLGDPHTVMVHIYNLRKKIELNPAKPKYVMTIRGVGYKFNDKYGE